jgi:hypothetical protein
MPHPEILSYDQYAELEEQGISMPYVVEVKQGTQRIVNYGAEHTNDPNHPQFADMERRWRSFRKSVARPIVLVEGHWDAEPPGRVHLPAGMQLCMALSLSVHLSDGRDIKKYIELVTSATAKMIQAIIICFLCIPKWYDMCRTKSSVAYGRCLARGIAIVYVR